MKFLLSTLPIASLLFVAWSTFSLAQERPVFKTALERQLESLVLPEVNFRDADLVGALRYLGQKSIQQSGGKIRPVFTLDLPEDFQTRFELTLSMNQIPAREALRYLGELAEVEFSFEAGAVVVRIRGASTAKALATNNQDSKPAAPASQKRTAGPLNKPAEPAFAGDNVHRTTAGVIQAEKSGYIPRRSMGGWSTAADPVHTVDVNCVKISVCPTDACGCKFCTCRKPPANQ